MTKTAAPVVGDFLAPASIAIVGFSSKEGSPSQGCLRNLEANHFAGAVHLVGRAKGEHQGKPVLGSIDQLRPGVDLALFMVPASAVLDSIEAATRRQVKAGVIFASGFAELGEEARRTQDRIAEVARQGKLSLVGPNCLGYTNYVNPLNVGFMVQPPIQPLPAGTKGAAAIVMQSGGLMGHVDRALVARKIPIAYRVSTGNEVDVQLADFLDQLAEDQAIGTFVLYAEQIRQPQKFLAAARRARAAGKHVVLMHSGRSEKAQHAAASHTGALAGDYGTMATVVRNAGVLLVETLELLVDATELLVRYPQPPTRGPALLVSSGAFCAHAHDVCEDNGLELPKFSADVMSKLAERMPGYLNLDNPFDFTTQPAFDRELVTDCLRLALSDPNFGSVMIYKPVGNVDSALHDLKGMVAESAKQDKPFLLSIMGEESALEPRFISTVRDNLLVFSRSSERQLRTLAAVTAYGQLLEELASDPPPLAASAQQRLPEGALAEWEAKKLLAQLDIPIAAGELATTADEASAIAARIGYPVVMKLQSRKLLHKTEVGGVLLGIADAQALRTGWTTLMERAQTAGLDSAIDGVLVERMAGGGVEVLVGATRSTEWGPVVMVGLGGVLVEALNDVRVFPAWFGVRRIRNEIMKLRAAKLLLPFRGKPARDVDALAKAAHGVGRLMLEHPEIEEVEINPLSVFEDGRGAVALDALVKVTH